MKFKIAFAVLVCVAIVLVNWLAARESDRLTMAEERLDLGFAWQLLAELVCNDGVGGLPPEFQSEWESLDIYAVDKDFAFASKPRFLGSHWQKRPCKTEAVTAALDLQTGVKIIDDYRGEPVLSAYGPVTIPDGSVVALMVELDVAEAKNRTSAGVFAMLNSAVLYLTVLLVLFASLSQLNAKKTLGELMRLRQAVRYYPGWLLVCDTKSEKVTNVSFALSKSLGLSESECVGRDVVELFPALDRAFIKSKEVQCAATVDYCGSEKPVSVQKGNYTGGGYLLAVARTD